MAAPRRRIGDGASGPTTFITPSTRIVGTITGQGAYVFCGTVEGECDIEGTATLAAGARWIGAIRATDLIVAGQVDGDVAAGRKVEVAETGRITGTLEGESVAIAQGAVIEGEITVRSGREPIRFDEKRKQ